MGNRVAVPLLEVAGYHVDALLTTLFSSMYVHEGQCLDWSALSPVVSGLAVALAHPRGGGHVAADVSGMSKEVTMHDYDAAITGYIGSVDLLTQVAQFIRSLKKVKPVMWVCDPVLGDNGHLYVAPAMVETYIREALPLADFITPNHFELQCLVRRTTEFNRVTEVKEACVQLIKEHQLKGVICTSVPIDDRLVLVGVYTDHDVLHTFHQIIVKHDVYYGGAGDFFTAAFVLAMEKFNWQAVEKATLLALRCTQQCIKRSMESPEPRVDINVIGSLHPVLDILNE